MNCKKNVRFNDIVKVKYFYKNDNIINEQNLQYHLFIILFIFFFIFILYEVNRIRLFKNN
jgi:hypothetical protein